MTDPRGVPSAHLDAATIAAFVDRTLDPAARAAAEAHLAGCADCREVWVETSELVSEEAGGAAVNTVGAPIARPRLRRWIYGGGGLAIAAAIAFAVFSPRLFDRSDRPELQELVEAVGTNRRTEARLTGGFKWGPVPSVTRGEDTASTETEISLAAIRLIEENEGSAFDVAAAGIADLILGNPTAVSGLTEATRLSPGNADYWSDLAAAHLETAKGRGALDAAERALEATERALSIAPSKPEALFNRALALEALGRRTEARRAWEAFLAIDSDSLWAREVRERLERLSR